MTPPLPVYLDSPGVRKPWSELIQFYRELTDRNSQFAPLLALVRQLKEAGFPSAGLQGRTSMHDLALGLTAHVFENPHLRVSLQSNAQTLVLTYEDGSNDPWTREVPSAETFEAVQRFLVKRARWFRLNQGELPSAV